MIQPFASLAFAKVHKLVEPPHLLRTAGALLVAQVSAILHEAHHTLLSAPRTVACCCRFAARENPVKPGKYSRPSNDGPGPTWWSAIANCSCSKALESTEDDQYDEVPPSSQ